MEWVLQLPGTTALLLVFVNSAVIRPHVVGGSVGMAGHVTLSRAVAAARHLCGALLGGIATQPRAAMWRRGAAGSGGRAADAVAVRG